MGLYDSNRPTTRPAKPGLFDTFKSHATKLLFVGTFLAAVSGAAGTAYKWFATDEELMDHNMDVHAHPGLIRGLEDRVAALETLHKEHAEMDTRRERDLEYVGERFVRLIAADAETNRHRAADAGNEAVEVYRALLMRGVSVTEAVRESLRRR